MWVNSGGAKPDLLADGPDETGKLARDGDENDLARLAKCEESPIPPVEAVLGNPGDPPDLLGETFAALFQVSVDARWMAIRPR